MWELWAIFVIFVKSSRSKLKNLFNIDDCHLMKTNYEYIIVTRDFRPSEVDNQGVMVHLAKILVTCL